MHKARLFGKLETQRLGQTVDMAAMARPTLGGQARGLVQRDDMIVAPDHSLAHHRGIGIGNARRGHDIIGRSLVRQGRDADGLARLDPAGGFGARAIDTDLTFAAHLFDAPLRDMGKLAAEPAIKALIAIAHGNRQGLNAAHARLRPRARPSISAASERMTFAKT